MSFSWLWVFFMPVTPGPPAFIGFVRKCSNGKGSRINSIEVIKAENQKTSPHKRQRGCWKEAFYLGQVCVSSWLIWNYPEKLVSQERTLPKDVPCSFQGRFLGDRLTQLLGLYWKTQGFGQLWFGQIHSVGLLQSWGQASSRPSSEVPPLIMIFPCQPCAAWLKANLHFAKCAAPFRCFEVNRIRKSEWGSEGDKGEFQKDGS